MTARPVFAPDWFIRRRVKLRHLQLVVALDEHRNMNRAAASIGLTQPAASRLLGELEELIDGPAFVRRSRGVAPNDLGQMIAVHARAILGELEDLGSGLEARKVGHAGVVAIGVVNGAPVELAAPVVSAAHDTHPLLQINMTVDNSDVLIQLLRDHALDFAVCSIPRTGNPAPFLYENIGNEEISILCGEDHPLTARSGLRMADLLDWTWILPPLGAPLRRWVDNEFLANGLSPPARVIGNVGPSLIMTLAVVGASRTLSAASAALARRYAAGARCRTLDTGQRLMVTGFGLLRLKERVLSPSAATLWRALRLAADTQWQGEL